MRRQSILKNRIACHKILLRVAARDGDAFWTVKHQAAIHRLTVQAQAADMRKGAAR